MRDVQPAQRGEVTIRDLSKSFSINGRNLSVLRSLNLDIGSGESLAIVGASGSGKTTLLRILAGLEEADSGGVLIDGNRSTGLEQSGRSFSRNRDSCPGSASLAMSHSHSKCGACRKSRHAGWRNDTFSSLAWLSSARPCRRNCRVGWRNASALPARWRSNRKFCCWANLPSRDLPDTPPVDFSLRGRSPGSRVVASVLTFPKRHASVVLQWTDARRLQLRGQLRHCSACRPRAPYSRLSF